MTPLEVTNFKTMKSILPTQNKLPKSYINYLYKVVNAEDADITIPLPEPEPYRKEKLIMTETFKSAFGSLIGKLSM